MESSGSAVRGDPCPGVEDDAMAENLQPKQFLSKPRRNAVNMLRCYPRRKLKGAIGFPKPGGNEDRNRSSHLRNSPVRRLVDGKSSGAVVAAVELELPGGAGGRR